MSSGLLRAVTGALGKELTDLYGFVTTRLTAVPAAEIIHDGGVGNVDYDGTVTLTLTSGVFSTAITAGQTFEVQSGTFDGETAVVLSRDSDTQVTLDTALPSLTAFSGENWKIITPAATSVAVETALNFPATGQVVIDGTVYSYTSKTVTTLDGLSYVNNLGETVSGVIQAHEPLSIVSDYSRITSAMDTLRRSFMVNYATGEDLNIIGRALGVDRPSELEDDDIYRALIKAVAYAPRGTLYAIEQALDALLGEGNYQIFEDLTLGSVNNNNTVFIIPDGTSVDPESSIGKGYSDGNEAVPVSGGSTSVVMPNPNAFLKIAGVTAAEHKGPRLVDFGVDASSVDGITITGPASTFSDRIQKGDIFVLKNSQSKYGTVISRDSDTQITLGTDIGVLLIGESDDGGTGSGFTLQDWEIRREAAQFKFFLPSDDGHLDEDLTTEVSWDYSGEGLEAGHAIIRFDSTHGNYLQLQSTPTEDGAYRLPVRIEPSSRVEYEITWALPAAISTSTSDVLQVTFGLADGQKALMIGAYQVGAFPNSTIQMGIWDGTDLDASLPQWTAHDGNQLFLDPGYFSLKIVKNGTKDVKIYRKVWRSDDEERAYQLVADFAYDDIVPTSATWAASYTGGTERELTFGCYENLDVDVYIKYVDWQIENFEDYWQRKVTLANGSGSGQTLTDGGGGFVLGDVGKFVTITNFDAVNANRGNPLVGPLEIETFTDANNVTVVGERQRQGNFTALNTSVFIAASDLFAWPNHEGHSIEILTGSNAGIYPIVDIVDSNFDPIQDGFGVDQTLDLLGTWTDKDAILVQEKSQYLLLDTSSLPSGQFVTQETDVEWRVVPSLNGNLEFNVSDAGTESAGTLTLPAATPFADGTLMDVQRSTVLNGYVLDPTNNTTLITAPDTYSNYPLVLFDAFGYVRGVIDILTAAGVIADFDNASVDSAGVHILE